MRERRLVEEREAAGGSDLDAIEDEVFDAIAVREEPSLVLRRWPGARASDQRGVDVEVEVVDYRGRALSPSQEEQIGIEAVGLHAFVLTRAPDWRKAAASRRSPAEKSPHGKLSKYAVV